MPILYASKKEHDEKKEGEGGRSMATGTHTKLATALACRMAQLTPATQDPFVLSSRSRAGYGEVKATFDNADPWISARRFDAVT